MQIAHAIEPRGASWTLNHKCVHLHYDMVKKKVGRYDTRVLLWYLVCYDKILTAQCTLKLIRTIFNLDTLNKKRKHNTRLWFTYICPDAEWIRNYVLIEFILRNIKKTTYIFLVASCLRGDFISYFLLSSFFLSTIYNLPIFLFSTKVPILIFSDLVQRSY